MTLRQEIGRSSRARPLCWSDPALAGWAKLCHAFGVCVWSRSVERTLLPKHDSLPWGRECHLCTRLLLLPSRIFSSNSCGTSDCRFVILRRVKRQFLIDTDTASDDAVALIMALRSPDIEVLGITTVAGNVDVHQASRNALYTAELCGSDVRIFTGAEKPLRRAHYSAHWFHGKDGLGDRGYPAPHRGPEKMSASDAIISLVESNSGLVLVTLGPLTNIALALQEKPGIADPGEPLCRNGGSPLLRRQRNACRRIQHLVRSGSCSDCGPQWNAGGTGRLASLSWWRCTEPS